MFPHVLISVHLSPLLYLLLWLSADGWLLPCFNLSGVLIVNIKYGHFKYLWRSKVYKVYTTTVKSDSSDSLGFLVKTLNTSPILVFYFTETCLPALWFSVTGYLNTPVFCLKRPVWAPVSVILPAGRPSLELPTWIFFFMWVKQSKANTTPYSHCFNCTMVV